MVKAPPIRCLWVFSDTMRKHSKIDALVASPQGGLQCMETSHDALCICHRRGCILSR